MNNRRNIIFIAFAGICVYINSLRNGFVWDDIFTVVNNDFIKGPKLIMELFSKPLYYFSDIDYLYYRPLQSLSNMFDYFIWGLNPFGFHLTNVLLHICAAILVYVFINTLFDDTELSFFAGLIFIVHPVNRSVVNHITSRSNILLAVFVLCSLVLFIKANNHKGYFLSLACFAAAIFSKEVAIVLPLFLILVNETRPHFSEKKPKAGIITARFWYMVFFIFAAAYVFLRIKMLGIKSGFLPGINVNFSVMLFTWLGAIAEYLKVVLLPHDFYMLRTIDIVNPADKNMVLWVIALVVIAAAFWGICRKNKVVFLSLGLFFIWLMPVASLSLRNPEYYFQQKAIIEEHWLYIPAIGIFVVMVYCVRKLFSRWGKKFYQTLFLLFIIYLSVLTFRENSFWRNNYTIFTRTLKYVKNSFTIYRNLGRVYISRNEINKAIEVYSLALNIKQDDAHRSVLYKDIAYAYFLNNRTDEAMDALSRALSINRNYPDAHGYLGLIYSGNNPEKAKGEWRIALDLDPFNNISFNGLLNLSGQDHDIRKYLIAKYENLLNRSAGFSDYKIYRALAILCLYNDMHSCALSNLSKAMAINPYDVKTNNALAVYYAKTGNFDDALKLFKAALKLNPFDRQVYRNFASFYNQLSQPDEARELMEKSESVNIYD